MSDNADVIVSKPRESRCTVPEHGQYDFILKVLDMISTENLHEDLLWHVKDGSVHFSTMCSDFFHWGCADAEEVETEEDLALLKQCLTDLGAISDVADVLYGVLLYASRRRGMRPMSLWLKRLLTGEYQNPDPRTPERIAEWKAKHAESHAKIHELFLAAGPERDPRSEG